MNRLSTLITVVYFLFFRCMGYSQNRRIRHSAGHLCPPAPFLPSQTALPLGPALTRASSVPGLSIPATVLQLAEGQRHHATCMCTACLSDWCSAPLFFSCTFFWRIVGLSTRGQQMTCKWEQLSGFSVGELAVVHKLNCKALKSWKVVFFCWLLMFGTYEGTYS